MGLVGLFDMVRMAPAVGMGPPMGRLTCSPVAAPVLLMFRCPALLMVPPLELPMEKENPLLKLRLSSESMLRLAAEPLMSRATGEAPAFPLSMKTLLDPVGTIPVLHLLALLQFPAPPSQMSL